MSEEIPNIAKEQEQRGEDITALASAFHDDWRKTRKQEDGSFEPRIKDTKDEAWIYQHGTSQVDIANTEFDDLPEDWQSENNAAAAVILEIIEESDGQIDINQPEQKQQIGDRIHTEWLKRNEWAKGGELDVPFSQLPKDEQDKDLNQMIIGLQVFSS